MKQDQTLVKNRQFLCCLCLLFFTINIVSSVLFLSFVNRLVYDDIFNTFDVHTYATKGLSLSSIRAQRNAPGPGSFIWMAGGVRLLDGDELRDSRIAVLFSWLLLGVGVFVGARFSRYPEAWYGALLSTLVLPHSVMATATVLTEGPSLLFATLGALAWTEFVSKSNINRCSLALGIFGGLSLGLAATCRQYYFSLLVSAFLIFLWHTQEKSHVTRTRWSGSVLLSLAVASLPVILMIIIWRGVSSPSMAAGASYSNYQAGLGLNIGRPIVAGFYALLYLLPFSYPAVTHVQFPKQWPALAVALVAGSLTVHFRLLLIQPGPLHSLLQAASRLRGGETILLGLIAGLAAYNAIAVSLILWRERSKVVACMPLRFALLTILFFLLEQLGVGGNIPFYDRYILQLGPFLGFIAFFLFPRISRSQIAVLIGLSALSQLLLWRYAFNG